MTREAPERLNFVIRKDDWSQSRFETAPPGELAEGQVLFRVDQFALTSNNITYAAAGDMLNYWGFFPAEEGWGRIPAMGFGDVVASAHPEVAEGQRVFGFFPMSTHLVVQAEDVGPEGFIDGVEQPLDRVERAGCVIRTERLVVCPQIARLAQFGAEPLLCTRQHVLEPVALLGDRAKLHLHIVLSQCSGRTTPALRVLLRPRGRPVGRAVGGGHHLVDRIEQTLRQKVEGLAHAVSVVHCHR